MKNAEYASKLQPFQLFTFLILFFAFIRRNRQKALKISAQGTPWVY